MVILYGNPIFQFSIRTLEKLLLTVCQTSTESHNERKKFQSGYGHSCIVLYIIDSKCLKKILNLMTNIENLIFEFGIMNK